MTDLTPGAATAPPRPRPGGPGGLGEELPFYPTRMERTLLELMVEELAGGEDHRLPLEALALPEKHRFLATEAQRYKVLYGGRGGAKSWSAARALLWRGARERIRVLCARELQVTIRDSVHRLLKDQIETLGLDRYDVTQSSIRHLDTNTEFIFKGLRHNIGEIKSLEGIDVCWVEEAESTSEESWRTLLPTIRKAGSEVWVTFNTGEETDPTYVRFVKKTPENATVRFVLWSDNPHVTQELLDECEAMRVTDPEAWPNVWGGEPWVRSKAEVLTGKWKVAPFEPESHWLGPFLGADFGFAQDPSTLVRVWIADNRLMVEYEVGSTGVGNDDLARMYAEVPGYDKHEIRADSARPETINHLSTKFGLNVVGVEKWGGSVEDGVAYLRSFDDIIIHPRCTGTAREARFWRYKTDPKTGEIVRQIVDAHNHYWDAIRYALQPLIRLGGKQGGDILVGRA